MESYYRHNGSMKAYWCLLPGICMAAAKADDTTIVFQSMLNEAVYLIESIQDAESADLYAAQLKTRGEFLMGLALGNDGKGEKTAFTAELKQRMQAGIKRIKQANFYNSRIMMAAYDKRQLATLPPPTDEEKTKTKARILAAFADNHTYISHINNKQSAETCYMDMLCTMRLLRCAHTAKLVDAEHDTDIQQQIQLMMQDTEKLSRQFKEQHYYNSILIKEIFQ